MATVYKKREYVGNTQPAPPPQRKAKVDGKEWIRGNNMVIHTPDFEPMEVRIDHVQQTYTDGIAGLKFQTYINGVWAWITLTITPKMALASRCYLAHNDLHIHFPFPRPGKSKHQFDIVKYDNVIVTENEVRVWVSKVEPLQSVAEKKVFNPKQLKLF